MKTKGIVLTVALSATLLGCSKEVLMPENLIGVWRTADKKYADRYFELNADRVIFSTGGWGVTAHPIDRMEKHTENGRPYYIIFYPNEEGDEYQFSFYHDPIQDVIRFKNQEQMEWVKWNEEMMDEETTDDEVSSPGSSQNPSPESG